VMPGSKCNVVDEAKDLNPRSVRLFRCTRRIYPPTPHAPAPTGRDGRCVSRRLSGQP
jgi:hypothetical protein